MDQKHSHVYQLQSEKRKTPIDIMRKRAVIDVGRGESKLRTIC